MSPSDPSQLHADSPPCRPTENASFLERFLSNFFHESNIRWMLLIGAAIVLASSVMLVSREWSHWDHAIHFGVILGYTVAIYGASEFVRRRLALLKTAHVLDGLSVLLFPISFLSLSWFVGDSGFHPGHWIQVGVGLSLATATTWFASRRIFQRWFHAEQLSFQAAYLILCIAGVVPELRTPSIGFGYFALTWIAMTLGVMKVNRSIFWTGEEHRMPKVFGFLPIALLGTLFLALIGMKVRQAIPLEWFGFGCVLLATTILLTARRIADVYRQRTGGLIYPLPWEINVPMLVGTTLALVGVGISFYGFSYTGVTTYAIVPSATFAAGLMWLAARDTRYSAFTWIAIVLATIAYQCTPTLVSDWVQVLKAGASAAIHEDRLPFAFYGLTYLPLLLAFAFLSRKFRLAESLFLAVPLQRFATSLGLFLFLVSMTNGKALFFVALTSMALFLTFAILFADRRYVIVSLIASLAASIAFVPVANSMGWISLSWVHIASCTGMLALGLLISKTPDRLFERIPVPNDGWSPWRSNPSFLMARSFGTMLVLVASAFWTPVYFWELQSGTNAFLIPTVILLLGFALVVVQQSRYEIGFGFALFVSILGGLWSVTKLGLFETLEWTWWTALPLSLVGFFIIDRIGGRAEFGSRYLPVLIPGFARNLSNRSSDEKRSLISRGLDAFVLPFSDLYFGISLLLIAFLGFPLWCYQAIATDGSVFSISAFLSLCWTGILVLRWKSSIGATLAVLLLPLNGILLLSSTLGISMTPPTMMFVCATTSSLIAAFVHKRTSRASRAASTVSNAILIVVLVLSFSEWSWIARLAAFLSIATLARWTYTTRNLELNTVLAIALHVQFLQAWTQLQGIHHFRSFLTQFSLQELIATLPLVAVGIPFFDRRWAFFDPFARIVWSSILRLGIVAGLLVCITADGGSHLDLLLQGVAILVTCGVLCGSELYQAYCEQKEPRLWTALGSLGLALIWMHSVRILSIGGGTLQFTLIGAAFASLLASTILERFSHFAFARPMVERLATILPAIAVALGIMRVRGNDGIVGHGLNALAMLSAAAIYFHLGLVRSRRGFVVLAAIIANIGLLQMFHFLRWTDLQLYLVPVGFTLIGLVEILRKDLPIRSHDPIRYLGTFTILVSPLYSIFSGSWVHLFSLLLLCVVIILAAIGFRLRALMYTGTAFLFADLGGMIVRSTMDHPGMLWIGGIAMGAIVIALAAICENHREQILVRVRRLTAELATWN